ncbi:hypothetical protein WR25_17793 [Diploscapter pachys]|uniref:Peptidase M13 C-terminal domain-containing protein n=1 Tax=Diploscapter pachys TaxID=2018661 RepID=A0A2A2LF39_9BILA|nr:hypothetical protein WR25_17793 [Diploscapter pachys]
MHSAWRAYHAFTELYGPDPSLPDDVFQYFTSDQLFFLAFAQVWCQVKPTDAQFLRQILVDVHSPSIYRVLGTIQNFPGFRTAFNCPPDSIYAPSKHCDVWVSDVSTQIGLPVVKNPTNIEDTPQITSGNVDKFAAYQQAVSYFTNSTDTTVDPCDDFYQYACGKFNQPVSFFAARAQNLYHMADQLKLPSYQPVIQNSTALTKEKKFFDSCSQIHNNGLVNQTLVQNKYIDKMMDDLYGLLGQKFFVDGAVTGLPNSAQLGASLGYLSYKQGIDTLITPLVDTNWKDPSKGYRLFIDQNSAYMAKTYYKPDAWKITRDGYIETCMEVIRNYTRERGKPFDSAATQSLVQNMVDFEQVLAYNLSTDDDTRRQFNRSWNLMSNADLTTTYPFIDWNAYFKQVPDVASGVVNSGTYQVSVMEVDMIGQLNSGYTNKKFDATTLVNYLYMRLLLGSTIYLPSYSAAFDHLPEESAVLGLSRREKTRFTQFRPQLSVLLSHRPIDAESTPTEANCANMANNLMQFANGRVFIDYMYPNQASIDSIRQQVGGIIGNILTSFQGMLDQLDWMDQDTRKFAYDKTVNIIKNIAFPDWIKNDTGLDLYHDTLNFVDKDTYFDMLEKLTAFNLYIQYKQLTVNGPADRHDFLGQPGTVNAWYQPELNSITFPAGILVPPYFNPQWPSSINYGGMGLVAGHELTHGFDDGGVQWTSDGTLNPWMTNSSLAGFQNMADCVIKEYSKFCPLPSNYTPNCVNGYQTQGENIADNGGIHAAFNAYRTHLALDGLEPLLPDKMLTGQFTHDQLFFLGYAQVWCQAPSTNDAMYIQLMVDPHSPSFYRVMGAIRVPTKYP